MDGSGTSGYSEDSHHTHYCRVDRYDTRLYFLEEYANHRQDDDEHVQLIPPGER